MYDINIITNGLKMLNLKQKFINYRVAHYLKKANLLYVSHNYARAVKLYQKILLLSPQHFAAYCNLATAYYEMEDYTKALPLLEHLANVDSNNPWWQTYLSKIYQNLERYQEALDAAWKGVLISNFASEHQINLAYSFYEIASMKGKDSVIKKVDEFYQKCPDSGIAKQCYFSFHFDKKFTADNPEYIEKMFDIFAPEFDKVLAGLEYDSPKQIAESLSKILPSTGGSKIILDLGRGSGLCGQVVSQKIPFAKLIGVDISSVMLHHAASKNIYSHLIKQEITSYLNTNNDKFDVIISSDVFTYFGALDSLFLGVANHLSQGGIFIFTISENNLNSEDYFLHISSRFIHQFNYVKRTLEKSGFSLLNIKRIPLRKEGDKDVVGGLFIAVKK